MPGCGEAMSKVQASLLWTAAGRQRYLKQGPCIQWQEVVDSDSYACLFIFTAPVSFPLPIFQFPLPTPSTLQQSGLSLTSMHTCLQNLQAKKPQTFDMKCNFDAKYRWI